MSSLSTRSGLYWEDLAQDEDLLVLDISFTEKYLINVVSAPDRVWAVHECSAQKIVSRDV